MDSTTPSKLDERLCSSPESGFGSEHQYSPVEPTIDTAVPSTSNEEANIVHEQGMFTFESGSDNDAFSCLKIVNVQSLAASPSYQSVQEAMPVPVPTTPQESIPVTKFQVKAVPVDSSTRLYVHHQKGKKILVLDPSSTSMELAPCADINVTNIYNSDDKDSPICIPFSGLPVISKRKRFNMQNSCKDNFVVSMLHRDERRRYYNIHSSSYKRSQSFSGSNSDRHPSLGDACPTMQPTTCIEAKPTAQELKLAVEICEKHQPQILCSSNVTNETLHSSSIITSVGEISKSTKTYENVDSGIKTSEKDEALKQEVNNSTTIIQTGNESKNISVKPELKSNKADRIKRLKELLQQKEKNLQQVRKNCGFIS